MTEEEKKELEKNISAVGVRKEELFAVGSSPDIIHRKFQEDF